MTPNVAHEVIRIVSLILDEEPGVIKRDTLFQNLDTDSLGYVEILLETEEDFEIDIPDEDAQKFLSVQDLIDFVQKTVDARVVVG